ncbi:hypothetical protein FJZ28_04955 [Candidatus Peregrinibacteria bacterium]|nr:hypothetical protein [Candidatus Peregrinibacteria bacterium]MBM3231639.1 hypothetical protein [Candidatus Peregrinibacteria bacterium]
MVGKLLFLLAGLATIASLVGVYVAHFGLSGSFGTTAASLSLLAFPVNVMLLWKLGKAHCSSCSACGTKK